MKHLLILLFTLLITISLLAQTGGSWNLLLVKKGKKVITKPNMATYSPNGFYLYRNCVYEVTVKGSALVNGRLIDIKPDTLYFTNFLNENVAKASKATFDTLALHYSQLEKLKLISDKSMGWYKKYSLSRFEFRFQQDTARNILESEWIPIFLNDTSSYELVPHLTVQGVNRLYEVDGVRYYFAGVGTNKP